MNKRLQITLFILGLLLIISTLAWGLFNASRNGDSLAAIIGLLAILGIGLLFYGGTWIIRNLVAAFSDSQPARPAKPASPAQKEPPPPSSPKAQVQPSLDWVQKEYPDALLISSREIIEKYREGERNFQNAYPSAVEPYETYLKWTILDAVDFSRALLYRAPFDGTSLNQANLTGAFLEGASFRGASLQDANLTWADLSKADFSGADLTGADLSYASLSGADFSNAILTGTSITQEQLESAGSLNGAVLPDES